MKKTIIVLGCLSFSMAYTQSTPAAQRIEQNVNQRVGINTELPQASVDVKELLNGNNPVDARIQGLSLPNFTTEQRSKLGEGQTESMKIGTLIYNTTKRCIEMYLGYYDGAHQWSCNLSGEINTAANNPLLNVKALASGFDGIYVAGVNLDYSPYRYVKFKIRNNSLFPISNVDFSKAVTLTNGGTVSVVAGQHTNITINGGQERELLYRITGTLAEGVLKADFNGPRGLTATQQIDVPKAVATIQDVIIETRSFDTTQGTMSTRTISIPFTQGLGRYDAVDIDVTPLDGENGDQNGMKLTIPAGSFSTTYATNSTITARLTVDGDNLYNIKKNVGGLKQDYATFRVTLGATSFNVILRSLGGYEAFIEQEASRNYTRNNCGSGYTGETVAYKRTATMRGISWSNQTEADNNSKYYSLQEAQRLVNIYADGQDYANTNGRCTSTGTATIADYTHTPILSFDVTQGELRDGLTINVPYTSGVYGGYEAVETTPIATAVGEGGDINNISVSIPKGTYNSGSGNIPVTIKVDGDQNYLVKKTEGDNNGYTIVTIPVTMSTGQTFNIVLNAKGGWREQGTYTGTGTFRKNDCGPELRGSDVSYTGTANGEGVSSVSKADAISKANANAKAKFDEQGQQNANQNGICLPKRYETTESCNITDHRSSGTWVVTLSGNGKSDVKVYEGDGPLTTNRLNELVASVTEEGYTNLVISYPGVGHRTGWGERPPYKGSAQFWDPISKTTKGPYHMSQTYNTLAECSTALKDFREGYKQWNGWRDSAYACSGESYSYSIPYDTQLTKTCIVNKN